MAPQKRIIPPKGAFWIDGISALNIGNAEYSAFRKLRTSEYEFARTAPAELSPQSTKAMIRLGFTNRLRYSYDLDITDVLEERDRSSLEVYLLCTCLDTLAGKEDFCDLQTWLRVSNKARNHQIQGLNEKYELLNELNGTAFSVSTFRETVDNLLTLYNESYGVNRNLLELIRSLPEKSKERLASMYTIHKKGEDPALWERKTTDDKLKVIFIDYLFTIRRNKYTHTGETFRHFGGIASLRIALSKGTNYTPLPATLEFQQNEEILVVTCKYGDEALFLREVILACIAKIYGVLDSHWIKRYERAEMLRQRLLALQYELSYNLNVLQSHLGVLSEGFIIRDNEIKNNERLLLLEDKFASKIHLKKRGFSLPFAIPLLDYYLDGISSFNNSIQQRPNQVYLIVNETGINRWLQKLREICEDLLGNYPRWVYEKNYTIYV